MDEPTDNRQGSDGVNPGAIDWTDFLHPDELASAVRRQWDRLEVELAREIVCLLGFFPVDAVLSLALIELLMLERQTPRPQTEAGPVVAAIRALSAAGFGQLTDKGFRLNALVHPFARQQIESDQRDARVLAHARRLLVAYLDCSTLVEQLQVRGVAAVLADLETLQYLWAWLSRGRGANPSDPWLTTPTIRALRQLVRSTRWSEVSRDDWPPSDAMAQRVLWRARLVGLEPLAQSAAAFLRRREMAFLSLRWYRPAASSLAAQQAGGHAGPIQWLVWLNGSARLLSLGADGQVKVWEGESGHLIETLNGVAASSAVPAFSPIGNLVAVNTDEGIKLWAMEPGAGEAMAEASPGGKGSQVIGDKAGWLGVWLAESDRPSVAVRLDQPIGAVAVTRGGTLIAAGDVQGNLSCWCLESGGPRDQTEAEASG